MKKFMRKIALVLSCVMMMGLLGGCGSFDASAYLAALLDNSYKNDSTAIVELEIGTAEEAAELYEEGVSEQIAGHLASTNVSEEDAEGLREVVVDILANAKYTVGEAEKQDDGSYVVTVSYEQMNIYAPAMEAYLTAVEEMYTEWTEAATAGEEVPSDEEMLIAIIDAYVASLEDSLANVTYDEAQTTTVRIELVDGQYVPNETDIYNLTNVMFDNEDVQ